MMACPTCLSSVTFSPNGYGRCACEAVYAWSQPPAAAPVWQWKDPDGQAWRLQGGTMLRHAGSYLGWEPVGQEAADAVTQAWSEAALTAQVLKS